MTDKSLLETGVTGTVRSGSSNTVLSERMPDPNEFDGATGRGGESEIKHESANTSSTETRVITDLIEQIRMLSFQGDTRQS